ncbi:MAG: aldo/keto reductase, partial [Actinomycetota bacterium]
LVHRHEYEAELAPLCEQEGIGVIPYSPLAAGFLTGKYRPGQPAPEGTRLALRPHGYDALLTPAVHEAIDRLRLAAAERGLSCGALALAWLLHDDAVAALITGPARNAPHLGLATEALRFDMDPDLHAEIGDWFRSALRG